MSHNIQIIVYPVKDVDRAKRFFSAFLGIEPYVADAYYVGYRLDGLEVGLDPNGNAVVSYIDVDDIEASLETLKDAGAEIVMDSKGVGGGLLIAQVEIDGNVLGLRQETK